MTVFFINKVLNWPFLKSKKLAARVFRRYDYYLEKQRKKNSPHCKEAKSVETATAEPMMTQKPKAERHASKKSNVKFVRSHVRIEQLGSGNARYRNGALEQVHERQ